MEALNFLKFWKPTVPFPTPVIEIRSNAVIIDEAHEEEDSFFDLEISSPKFDETRASSASAEPAYPKPSLCLSPINPIPKRRVLPVEPALKPQSPIALLKSAPNFRSFSFKKSKSTERARESARRLNAVESPKSDSKSSTSKDVIQRYLKLVKPLYVKVKAKAKSAELFASSPSVSPANFVSSPKHRSGIRVVCKQLGKSKSTTTTTSLPSFNAAQTTTASSSSGRRDDSLLQQHDGIQGAILHCKRSFNSSRDSFHLSRSTSDSSSIKSCSTTDSYRISHSASETSHDNSARNSV